MSSRTLGREKCSRNRDPDYDRLIYNRSRVDIDFALKMWKQENARRKQPMHYRRRFATSSVQEQTGNIDQQVVPTDPEWFVVPEEERIVVVEEPEELLVLVNPEALVVQMGIEDLGAPGSPEQRMTPPVNLEQRMTPPVNLEQRMTPPVNLEQRMTPPVNLEQRMTPPVNLEQRMTPPVNPEQRMVPPVNPEQRMTPPGNPDQLVAPQVNPEQLLAPQMIPEQPVIPAENDGADEDVGPTDFDPSLLIQKLLKREVSPPPSSPYSRDYFLDPPVYLDISGTDTVEISEEDFHVTAYAPAITQSDSSQMQSVPISAFLQEDESVQYESNSATLHYQVQRDHLMPVHHEAEQGTQYVHPASQTQPLLLNLSQFIDADRAAARCREIGYAATQKEIANFAALINARRSFSAYQYQDNRMTNSWQP